MLLYSVYSLFVLKNNKQKFLIYENLILKKFPLIENSYTEFAITSSKEQRHDTNQGFKQSL